MKKLRVGVVGVGHIGSSHARLYSGVAGAELAAVYDVDPGRANTIAKKLGTTVARSLDEFADSVDAASICAPTKSHHEIALPLLKRGKHLLVEKPIAENPQHATELAEVAARNGLILQVGHVERFNPVLSALEARLTHPRFIEAHRLSPYPNRSTDIGVILDLMIHDRRRRAPAVVGSDRAGRAIETAADGLCRMRDHRARAPRLRVPGGSRARIGSRNHETHSNFVMVAPHSSPVIRHFS